MSENINIAAVILAGGRGQRMGGNFKQFLKINRKPLILYSLEKFISCRFIKKIIVVIPKEKLVYVDKIICKDLKDSRIKLVAGGKTRRWSAYNGLKYLADSKNKIDYVIFHDAARPLVSTKMIKTVIDGAKKWGAAVIGIKAIDLIFKGDNNFISEAINKGKIYYGYMPQCFKFSQILKAHSKFEKNRFLDTADNTELLKKLDKKTKIRIIDKFYPNLKLTYKPDIKAIQVFLKK